MKRLFIPICLFLLPCVCHGRSGINNLPTACLKVPDSKFCSIEWLQWLGDPYSQICSTIRTVDASVTRVRVLGRFISVIAIFDSTTQKTSHMIDCAPDNNKTCFYYETRDPPPPPPPDKRCITVWKEDETTILCDECSLDDINVAEDCTNTDSCKYTWYIRH